MIETISAEEYRRRAGAKDGKKPPKMCERCNRPKVRCECLELALLAQIRTCGLPEPVRELVFAKPRRWRFDFAYPDRMIAVECEGGTWTDGAHVRGKHVESDCNKYNEAALRGWTVLRFTTDQIKEGWAIRTIERALGMEAV